MSDSSTPKNHRRYYQNGISVTSHYDEMKKQIAAKVIPNLLMYVLLYIEQQAKLILTDNDRIDTGFLRNSGYVMGLGMNTYTKTKPDGTYPGAKGGGHRERAPAQEPSAPQNRVVFGFTANYAFWIEQMDGFLMKSIVRAQTKFGSAIRVDGTNL